MVPTQLSQILVRMPGVRTVPLAIVYRKKLGRWPNLLAPKRFTEKLQVAKLTWRSPLMTKLADKVLAKNYVSALVGADWVTPTLYAGPDLPPVSERRWPVPYVIKANDRSSATIFVHSEEDKDWSKIDRTVNDWFAHPYTHGYQWAYTGIRPQVLVEPYIGSGAVVPIDYKFYVFGGRVEFIRVHTGRFVDRKGTTYDRDWRRLPFGIKVAEEDNGVAAPSCLREMVEGAEALARGFPFVRIDLYEIEGKPRFSEVTFYPDSGYLQFRPEKYDLELGKLWPPGRPTANG